jgi:hypothetical protein
MNKFNDDFIADAIIQSEYLEYKYNDVINKINNNINITPPTSDLDPYYIIETTDTKNKIKLKASYIGKRRDNKDLYYVKWSWSDPELSKASKVNLLKIFKYFLDQEPSQNINSPVFMMINRAFIQSFIQVDERFFHVLMNALLHLMKHIFYILVKDENDNYDIYFVKEII